MKTFLLSLVLVLGAMFSGLALATQPGNNGGGNGGCGVGQQTNGCGGATGGQGGAGGAGGAGGNGTGVGVGVGVGIANAAANAAAVAGANSTATGGNAAVVGSGNSSVRNTQQQGQSQSSRNSNQSSATGGAGGAATATGGASGGNTFTVEGDKGDVIYAPAQERNPVATAYAAPLTATNGTCMGSSSGGAQSAAFGFSVGTTWTDGSCDIRYDAEALRAAGLPMAARARLCQKPEIAKAMEAAGTPCPKARTAAAATVDGEGFAAKRQPMPWQAGG